jgi:hypothetical protein
LNTIITIMVVGIGVSVVMLVTSAVHKGEFGNLAYQAAFISMAVLVVGAFTALVVEVTKFFVALKTLGWS